MRQVIVNYGEEQAEILTKKLAKPERLAVGLKEFSPGKQTSYMSDVEKVKNLRESTGLSFNEIKKALDEADGDEAKAVEVLKAQGVRMAEKKSSREVSEGVVSSYIHATKKLGTMVEVLCETDFVARNSDFQELAKDIAMHIAAMKPETVEDLLGQPFVKNPDMTIRDLVNSHIAKLGENIQIGQFEIFQI